jgi:hypothetical protein
MVVGWSFGSDERERIDCCIESCGARAGEVGDDVQGGPGGERMPSPGAVSRRSDLRGHQQRHNTSRPSQLQRAL